jgi:hypothetical protein
LSAVVLNGCAAGKLRSTSEMENSNPMKSIALISYGSIQAKYNNYDNAINIGYSKSAAKFLTSGLQTELARKGYKVDYARPVGVGFSANTSRTKNIAYEDSINSKFGFMSSVINDNNPVYVFPEFDNTDENTKRIKSVLLGFSNSIKSYTSWRHDPDIGLIEQVGKSAGADTVCLLAVSGRKVTKSEKMREELEASMAKMMKQQPPPSAAGNEAIKTELMCVSLDLKKVVWQDYYSMGYTGEEPSLFMAQRTLKDFPDMGKPLDPGCQRPDKAKPMYLCGAKK